MSDAEYIQDAAEAAADIQADGYEATLYVSNPQAASAWDPVYDPETGTTIYVLETKHEEGYKDGAFFETVELLIAKNPVALDVRSGDTLLLKGKRFKIGECKPLRPGGIVVLWEAKASRG